MKKTTNEWMVQNRFGNIIVNEIFNHCDTQIKTEIKQFDMHSRRCTKQLVCCVNIYIVLTVLQKIGVSIKLFLLFFWLQKCKGNYQNKIRILTVTRRVYDDILIKHVFNSNTTGVWWHSDQPCVMANTTRDNVVLVH
jgi:hypothetical protein